MRNRTRPPSLRDDTQVTRDTGAWFRQPVVWLGGAVFISLLAACVVTIVLAWRNADTPIEAGGKVMGVPLRDAVTAPPPAPEAR